MLLWRRLDLATGGDAASVCLLDFVRTIDFERDVLDPYVVVPVLTAVRGPQAEALDAVLEVDDVLGTSVCRHPVLLLETEWSQNFGIEGD